MSIQLSRNTRRLLTTVKGRPHATAEDHEPESNATANPSEMEEIDVTREPDDSSSSSDSVASREQSPFRTLNIREESRHAKARAKGMSAVQIRGPSARSTQYLSTRQQQQQQQQQQATPPSSSQLTAASRVSSSQGRSLKDESDSGDDMFGDMVSSQGKRRKLAGSGKLGNPHTQPSSKKQYGKVGPETMKRKENRKDSKAEFMKPVIESKPKVSSEASFQNPLELTRIERDNEKPNKPPSAVFQFVTSSGDSKRKISPPKATFSLPEGALGSRNFETKPVVSSPLSSPVSIHSSRPRSATPLDDYDPSEDLTTCLYCQERIPLDLFNTFISTHNNGRSALRPALRRKLHVEHQREAALSTCRERGWPSSIDWSALPSRIARYTGTLSGILDGSIPSSAKTRLQSSIDSGNIRTTAQLVASEDVSAMMELVPGYYGSKGLGVFTDFITKTLAPALRARAGLDKLIINQNVTGYVQQVLVPELAVRIVAEDLGGLKLEEAWEVLRESREVGEVLHEDVEARRRGACEVDLDDIEMGASREVYVID